MQNFKWYTTAAQFEGETNFDGKNFFVISLTKELTLRNKTLSRRKAWFPFNPYDRFDRCNRWWITKIAGGSLKSLGPLVHVPLDRWDPWDRWSRSLRSKRS